MNISQQDLENKLDLLVSEWEKEVVEFKEVGNSCPTSDIGKYFSALANEANLRNCEKAWIVFGVNNQTREVVGTDYRDDHERLHGLKHQINQGTDPSTTFHEIYELQHPRGRVLMFEIPAAPAGIPIAWHGHYYARAGESLTSLGLDKQDQIRRQSVLEDWSVVTLPEVPLDQLDSEAIQKARAVFAQKHSETFQREEVMNWTDTVFLDRAGLTIDSKLTRAAILLLGKAQVAHHLSPHPAQLTWKLEGPEKAYQHFGPPFLLNTTALYKNIRNVQVRLLPDDQLFEVEVSKYDSRILLEALHNAIAHQDYMRNGRIIVTEYPEVITVENEGEFFEGSPNEYIGGSKTPRHYRNTFLTKAMVQLNMIDTMGYGIHRMYQQQARRYFPLPDYDLSEPGCVRVTIHGQVVDPAYTRLLLQQTDLSLNDILALDRVQKNLHLDDTSVRRLRRRKLIEGRRPNLHIAAPVAAATGEKAKYIQTRQQDDAFYKKLILDFLRKFGTATRKDIDELLMEKLGDSLDSNQKRNKIHNLLMKLRNEQSIKNVGSKRKPCWTIDKTVQS